jgi:hypothetical protein
VALGLVVAACTVAGAVTGISGAAAQGTSANPNPEPLWEAYPLDEGEKAQAQPDSSGSAPDDPTSAATPTPTTTVVPLASTEEAGDDPPWLLIFGAGVGGALLVVLLLALQARQGDKRRRAEARTATVEEWPWLKAGASSSTTAAPELRVGRTPEERAAAAGPATNGTGPHAAPPASDRPREREPAFDIGEPIAVPLRRFDRKPAPAPPPSGPPTARRGPICQVCWSRRAACFYAVTTDTEGVEHRLAWSPRVEWRAPTPPPEDNRRAQAALRVLAKDLRDKGWRPMRAKGKDFDELQWYARRFRFPVAEGEDDRAPWLKSRREVVGRRQGGP